MYVYIHVYIHVYFATLMNTIEYIYTDQKHIYSAMKNAIADINSRQRTMSQANFRNLALEFVMGYTKLYSKVASVRRDWIMNQLILRLPRWQPLAKSKYNGAACALDVDSQ